MKVIKRPSPDSRPPDLDSSDGALQRARVKLLSMSQDPRLTRPRIGALIDLAAIYWKRAEYPAAISLWQQAIALFEKENEPEPLAIAYTSLSAVYAHSGDYASALQASKKAVVISPKDTAVLYGLANAYDFAGEEAQTFSWLRRALSYDPGFALAYETLGRLHFRRGEFEQAEQFLRKTLELEPQADGAINELGNLYIAMGRFDEAMAQYRHSYQIDPKYPTAVNNIGYGYFRMGKMEEAKQWLERRVQIRADDALATQMLLGVIERLSASEKARKQSGVHLRRAMEIYQSRKAHLQFSRLIEHEAVKALILTAMGNNEAIATWQMVLESPDTKFVGKGTWGDWFYILQQLSTAPQPPPQIEEIIQLLTQHPKRF